jgi:hypothetical protein
LKRFLAPDLVFNLGIWLSFCGTAAADRGQPVMLGSSVLIEHFAAATAAL